LRHLGIPIGGAFDTEALSYAQLLLGRLEQVWEIPGLPVQFPHLSGTLAIVSSYRIQRIGIDNPFSLSPDPNVLRTLVAFSVDRLPPVNLAPPFLQPPIQIRMTNGPQFDLDRFPIPKRFRTTVKMNRLGIRAEPIPEWQHEIDMTSEACCQGAIQVTPDGTPIFIGPDGPTIGGYPKPFVVIRADLDLLARLIPNREYQLKYVTLEEARKIANINAEERARRFTELRVALSN
jgi:allophanate hydrolase subunit 2